MTTVLDKLCTILLSCKSGHIGTLTLYICVLQLDQYLAVTTYIYQTTLQVTSILTLDVVEATPSL